MKIITVENVFFLFPFWRKPACCKSTLHFTWQYFKYNCLEYQAWSTSTTSSNFLSKDDVTDEVEDEGGEDDAAKHHDHARHDHDKRVVVGVAQEKMHGAKEAQQADHDKGNVEDDILHRPLDANLNYDWIYKTV